MVRELAGSTPVPLHAWGDTLLFHAVASSILVRSPLNEPIRAQNPEYQDGLGCSADALGCGKASSLLKQ